MRCPAITTTSRQCKMSAVTGKVYCNHHEPKPKVTAGVVAPVFWNTCPMCNNRFQTYEQGQEYCSYACESGGGKSGCWGCQAHQPQVAAHEGGCRPGKN